LAWFKIELSLAKPLIAENKGNVMKTHYIVIFLVVMFVLAIKLLTPDRSLQPVLLDVNTSPEKQLAREKSMSQFKQSGVIDKIETPDFLPNVYVGERFNALGNDEKEMIMSTISGYYYVLNKKSSMVIIKDSKTKKKIGKYSQNGLSMKR
jgi:hypothetical protein